MKNLLFTIILLVVFQTIAQEKEIKTKVDEATVFLDGAQIVRKKTIDIVKGENILKFTNLSPFIDKKSIQIKAADVEIEAINFKKDFLKSAKKDINFDALEQKLEKIEADIAQNQLLININAEEVDFLKANKEMVTEKQNINVTAIKDAANFYGTKIKQLYTEAYQLKLTVNKLQDEKAKIEKEISNYTLDKNYGLGEITIKLNSKNTQKIDFELNYNVSNVSWYPTYDVRVKNINSPLEIVYKANLKQNSMIDWQDVKLKFSSANPSNSTQIKNIIPYFLNYGTYPPNYNVGIDKVSGKVTDVEGPLPGANIIVKGTTIGTTTDFDGNYEIQIPEGQQTLVFSYLGFKTIERAVYNKRIDVEMEEDSNNLEEVVVVGYGTKKGSRKNKAIIAINDDGSPGANNKITIRGQSTLNNTLETKQITNQTTFNFEVVKPYTVTSGNKDVKIPLQYLENTASYQYFSFPKVNKSAFLVAKLSNWEKLNLLEGEANIYFEDTFIGTSLLDTRTAKEFLEISLGVDKNVVIDRTKEENFNSKQFIGGKQEDVRLWNFTIKNNKQENINIEIIDQIPISSNEDIKVELDTDITTGNHNKATGEIKWNLNVTANKSESFKLKYIVKYPKGTTLNFD